MAVEKGRIRSFRNPDLLEKGLLNGAKKMSEFIGTIVVVVEGCNGCLLRAKHANLCLKVLFYKHIDLFLWHEE